MKDTRQSKLAWRVPEKCDNCPFATSGPGLHLRRSLHAERWREILSALRRDGMFPCHKTVEYDEDGEAYPGRNGLLCAGSLEWQQKYLGYVGQFARICMGLDALRAAREVKTKAVEK